MEIKLSVSVRGGKIFTELQEGSLLWGRGSEEEQRDPHDHLLRREILRRERGEVREEWDADAVEQGVLSAGWKSLQAGVKATTSL